jgi:hypothetical protein
MMREYGQRIAQLGPIAISRFGEYEWQMLVLMASTRGLLRSTTRRWSHSGHMRLVPAFLGWQNPGSAFSAAMQLAALAAVAEIRQRHGLVR